MAVDFTGSDLDRALAAGPIAPGASVEGWALLNDDAGCPPELKAVSPLRMVIEEPEGRTGPRMTWGSSRCRPSRALDGGLLVRGKVVKTLGPGNARGAPLGFEAQLWATANALRGSMDAAEDRHIPLGRSFPDLKADYILANVCEDRRWKFGVPPVGTANFAWVQPIIPHLGEGESRRNIIEADLVDCMVVLPGQLFSSTQILACLWFLARDKKNGRFRDRYLVSKGEGRSPWWWLRSRRAGSAPW
jgi:hypothetical protein